MIKPRDDAPCRRPGVWGLALPPSVKQHVSPVLIQGLCQHTLTGPGTRCGVARRPNMLPRCTVVPCSTLQFMLYLRCSVLSMNNQVSAMNLTYCQVSHYFYGKRRHLTQSLIIIFMSDLYTQAKSCRCKQALHHTRLILSIFKEQVRK